MRKLRRSAPSKWPKNVSMYSTQMGILRKLFTRAIGSVLVIYTHFACPTGVGWQMHKSVVL
ncbi:hypothetical protein GYMLUDRAFT_38336 [Collybiopsis luxurians FD-317 M1]|nr:hypothetical protein GYMLUDRAFT_38336 [Collybiopsis luxurians FD-317 M1]